MDNAEKFTGRQEDYAAGRPSYAVGFLARLQELYTPPECFTAADIGSAPESYRPNCWRAASPYTVWSQTRTCGTQQYRQTLTDLFDTFAVGGQLSQPNETLVYTGQPLL